MTLSDWVATAFATLFFMVNLAVCTLVGVAVWWYVQAQRPVVDWVDPDGPGFRVLKVTPEAVTVRWIELRLALDCPGLTEVTILGERVASHSEIYPFIIDQRRQTFERSYFLPPNLRPGRYQVRIIDTARCNPLFENRQILRVPFEVKP